jgi:acyl carrier protein
MDALAHSRRRRGAPAVSVNWGAWSRVGMASGAGDYLAAQGIAAFTPEYGLDALAYLLPRGPQAAFAAIDWTAYIANRHRGTPQFLREVVGDGVPTARPQMAKPSATQARVEIERAPIGRRSSLITATIARESAAVIGFGADREIDPRQPLGDLGLDSLMAVDLRNRLGQVFDQRFPATLLFDYPSIQALSAHVCETVFGLNGNAEAPGVAPNENGASPEKVTDSYAGQSEAELAVALSARLDTLQV